MLSVCRAIVSRAVEVNHPWSVVMQVMDGWVELLLRLVVVGRDARVAGCRGAGEGGKWNWPWWRCNREKWSWSWPEGAMAAAHAFFSCFVNLMLQLPSWAWQVQTAQVHYSSLLHFWSWEQPIYMYVQRKEGRTSRVLEMKILVISVLVFFFWTNVLVFLFLQSRL